MSFHILVVGTNLEFFSCFNRQKWSALDLISCLKFLSFIITKLELMHFPDCQRRNIWKHFRNNTAEIFCCAPGRPKGYTPHVRMRADGDIRSATCHPYLFSRVGICSTCSCTLLFLSFSLLIFVLAVRLSVSLSFPLPPSASLPSCATRRPSSVLRRPPLEKLFPLERQTLPLPPPSFISEPFRKIPGGMLPYVEHVPATSSSPAWFSSVLVSVNG